MPMQPYDFLKDQKAEFFWILPEQDAGTNSGGIYKNKKNRPFLLWDGLF